jgi:17beta-estradiol 17-dehydrogenase / very-long-chain 3-oxoacyl-CoA reductase
MALKTLSFLYRHTVKSQKNLGDRYNQGDSWAVVTGGSDGIGEQFCKDLANQGFNICVIARNEEKIK